MEFVIFLFFIFLVVIYVLYIDLFREFKTLKTDFYNYSIYIDKEISKLRFNQDKIFDCLIILGDERKGGNINVSRKESK